MKETQMIELSGLVKSYTKNEQKALDDLSITVKPGELYGFLGPNGAGKTTTIKIMIGLLLPDQGSARVAGIEVQKKPVEAKRRIGYVADEPLLYENMTGSRFLSFIADAFEVPGSDRGKIIDLADEFGLKDALGEKISGYSHGMKQKVAIIAALLHDPEVFILDEPIVGLDPQSSFILKEKMREQCRQGKTVFFSTHVMEVAERLCDRVGIIRGGKLIAEGPFEELRARAGDEDATLENLFLELTNENYQAG
jgi:ABC-2 type transport system ATP-binding protein